MRRLLRNMLRTTTTRYLNDPAPLRTRSGCMNKARQVVLARALQCSLASHHDFFKYDRRSGPSASGRRHAERQPHKALEQRTHHRVQTVLGAGI